mmetsp:Transcript_8208/g.10355  ORF Transcript_8208/g.10355 Transcript_8208/m.10355 type:complete len:91 (-) Transcript_8208:862-1134(-)
MPPKPVRRESVNIAMSNGLLDACCGNINGIVWPRKATKRHIPVASVAARRLQKSIQQFIVWLKEGPQLAHCLAGGNCVVVLTGGIAVHFL